METSCILLIIGNIFLNAEVLFMDNDIFYLRKMIEADYKNFLEVANEEAGVSCNSDEKFEAVFLEAYQQNATVMSIIDRDNQNYIGYVIIKHTNTSTPEIGISIRPQYQSQGIGTEAMKTAANLYAQSNAVDYYLIRVKSYNASSRRMIEKMGAKRLKDEGDVMLDVVKRFTQEIGGEQGKELLDKFLDGYNVEGQNVLQYRYDV